MATFTAENIIKTHGSKSLCVIEESAGIPVSGLAQGHAAAWDGAGESVPAQTLPP